MQVSATWRLFAFRDCREAANVDDGASRRGRRRRARQVRLAAERLALREIIAGFERERAVFHV
jgi:hypothetical protein